MLENKKYLIDNIKKMLILIGLILTFFFIYLTVNSIKNGNYILLIIISFIYFLLFIFIRNNIYNKYKEINNVYRLFYRGYIFKGIFNVDTYIDRDTEKIFNTFNEIIDNKNLIEGSKKHAEYLALQNQINPHFLYNTLEGIRSEAMIEGVDSISNMSESLALYFRYTISNVDKHVTLEDEINNVITYVEIQKFRFGDRINFEIIFDEEDREKILLASVPKLTLQPFVENAILHGVERKIGYGKITINIVLTNKRLIITVSDNGQGMPVHQVKELNDKLTGTSIEFIKRDKEGGIALMNVNSRIKLIFGDEYGVYIYSKEGVGTDAEIVLPYIMEE